MKKPWRVLALCWLVAMLHAPAVAAEKASTKDTDSKEKSEKSSKADDKDTPEPVTQDGSVTIAGKKLDYRVTAGKLRIEKDHKDDVGAEIFYVSYEKSGDPAPEKRPVMFAFNGGPGSSAVWLHIGFLGPKIIDLPGDGTHMPTPPVLLKDNALSLLDQCDLVFVDPVSTGYSRAEDKKNANQFHGVNEDIEAGAEFVRRWISENDRWASPKYILGESYGGLRAVGLSKQLFNRYGMNINGLIMLSSLMDYGTLIASDGHDITHMVFLPAYASVAHHHGKLDGDRDELVAAATEFAYGEYANALVRGADLPAAEFDQIATKLSGFSGLPAEYWKKHHLRVSAHLFRAELLRAEGKTLGRFDARVAWDTSDTTTPYASYDPSYALAYGAMATAMNDYLGREIGYKEDQPYEILTGKVHPWNWSSSNSVVNVSDRLHDAMVDNPQLRVLVMSAHCDLATPPESMAYSLRQMVGLPHSARERISTVFYESGHMFYTNPPDLKKAREDLVEFLTAE